MGIAAPTDSVGLNCWTGFGACAGWADNRPHVIRNALIVFMFELQFLACRMADELVLVLFRMTVPPLEIIVFFPAVGFVELTIFLVVFAHVLVIRPVFGRVPLVVVAGAFVVVPLVLVIRVVGLVGDQWH